MNKGNSFESDRISLNQTSDELTIEISGKIEPDKFVMLSAWLIAWTLSGAYVLTQLFTEMPSDQRIFMFAWMGFWIYFEYRVASAWLWRKYGKEVIQFGKDTTQLMFKVAYGGRAYQLQTSQLSAMRNLESEKGNFVKNYFNSFWVIGGETVGFMHKQRLYTFGRQLSEADANRLVNSINLWLQKHVPSFK